VGARDTGEVAVLHKALDILEFLANGETATVLELCAATAITKPTAYRILATLERRSYVAKTGQVRRYALGPGLHGLTRSVRSTVDLIAAARPAMRALWDEFGETVNLGLLNNGRILYVDILESAAGLRTTVELGASDHAHSTALGKSILAGLDEAEALRALDGVELVRRTPRTIVDVGAFVQELAATRERGYAIDDEENEVGSRCVAAAIARGGGVPLAAALSVSGPAMRMPDELVARIGARTREACLALGAAFA
jgi:IclR family acetate operon transcriptional repressor